MTHRLLQKPVAGAADTSADDAAELKWKLDEYRVCCVVFLSFRSVVEPSWGDRGPMHLGLSLFWFRSRTLFVSGCCNAIFMYCVKWRL